MDSATRFKLSMALTTYDRKQSTKKYYNPYALGLYLQALERCERMATKHDLRLCLLNCFNGKLLDVLLKTAGLPLSTKEECFVGGYPVIHDDE
jgi:hypothetical protein